LFLFFITDLLIKTLFSGFYHFSASAPQNTTPPTPSNYSTMLVVYIGKDRIVYGKATALSMQRPHLCMKKRRAVKLTSAAAAWLATRSKDHSRYVVVRGAHRLILVRPLKLSEQVDVLPKNRAILFIPRSLLKPSECPAEVRTSIFDAIADCLSCRAKVPPIPIMGNAFPMISYEELRFAVDANNATMERARLFLAQNKPPELFGSSLKFNSINSTIPACGSPPPTLL